MWKVQSGLNPGLAHSGLSMWESTGQYANNLSQNSGLSDCMLCAGNYLKISNSSHQGEECKFYHSKLHLNKYSEFSKYSTHA